MSQPLQGPLSSRIGHKLLAAFFGLSLVSLLLFGALALDTMRELGDYSHESNQELGATVGNDSRRSLQALGELMVEQKAGDVARQMEIYMKDHPNKSIAELQGGSFFQGIAVQWFSATDYTVVLDLNNGTYYFHLPKNHGVFVNKSAEAIFTDKDGGLYKPEIWELINQTVSTHSNSGGYYDWKEPTTGQVLEKYAYFAVVNATSSDDVEPFVAATVYTHSFFNETDLQMTSTVNDAVRDNDEHFDSEIARIEGLFFVSLVLLGLVVALFALLLARRITEPILFLQEGAKAVGAGDLDHRVEVRTGDELEELANTFNKMAADLKEQIRKVEETTRIRERMEQELRIATDIQKSFLPIKAPEVAGYLMAGINLPAREVGGDFYDFIELGDDKIGIVIADVSGKGVPAALFMGISKTLVRVNAKRILDPVESIREANAAIVEESSSGMFVTLFYAILDPVNNTLSYVNAGHNPPLLFRKGESDITLLKAKGIALGVMDDMPLETRTLELDARDLLFLYTDGVTEAENRANEEFGDQRLEEILRQDLGCSPEDIIQRVVSGIKTFAGDRKQFDDITMVVVQSSENPDCEDEVPLSEPVPGAEEGT